MDVEIRFRQQAHVLLPDCGSYSGGTPAVVITESDPDAEFTYGAESFYHESPEAYGPLLRLTFPCGAELEVRKDILVALGKAAEKL